MPILGHSTPRSAFLCGVHGGLDTGRFPERQLPALDQALRYLMWSPTLRSILMRLAQTGRTVFLEYHTAHTKFLEHNSKNLRIQWNPNLGLRDATGWLTPALLLGHELGHAQFTNDERSAMRICERPQGFECEAYGVEEASVIAHVERPAAAELNAARQRRHLPPLETAQRHQHQLGKFVDVAGPVSPDPDWCSPEAPLQIFIPK